MQVQEKDDGNVAADPALPESPSFTVDSPVTLQVSTEVESQICKPSVAAKQSTSPPTKHCSAISRQPPEAETSIVLGTEAAWDLQPKVQPSTSMQYEPAEAEDEPMAAHDLQSEIQPSASVPAEQSTGLPAQQSVATSHHPPAEAKHADILGTEPACDLQPEVQTSTSDEPAEVEDEVDDEPEVPEPEYETEVEDEPAEAERAGTLGAIAAQDLQPEMQSSTATQDVPFEQTYMSDMPVLESPTIHPSVEPSLDSHAGIESAGMVIDHDLQSEILPSASVPMEQSTSLPAQQSLATSGHSPAEAEPAYILSTEAAFDLQPSQGEVQPSTTMHDQPAEGQACILGTIAARSLHPETQPSTSKQSAPLERINLVGMPVLQGHTVEPSLDPHARAGSTHTLGSPIAHGLQSEVQPSASMHDHPADAEGAVMLGSTALIAHGLQSEVQPSASMHDHPADAEGAVMLGSTAPIAHGLQSEVQPSASMHDHPADAEGAVMLGSTAPQDLQPELQSSTPVQHVPLERIHSEESRQSGFQPNMVPGPEQPTEHPPVTTLGFNNPILSDEPLKNELDRLMHCNYVLTKNHEQKVCFLILSVTVLL
jgi:hypothetical protein